MTLRSTIQQIVLENRGLYGYRRVTVELRRQGMIANHKRVLRLMQEDNLLAVRQPASEIARWRLELMLNPRRRGGMIFGASRLDGFDDR